MAENKKSFIAYCNWMETFEELPDDKAGQLAKHLFRYVNDLNPQTDDILIKAVFANIKHTLKRDLKKYEQYIDKQKINGAKGGRPKKNPEEPKKPKPFSKNPTKPKKADSVNVSDSVNDNDINNIPVYEDFKNYALENVKDVDLESVELKYKAWVENGWKDGNNKQIKKWKVKLLNTLQYLPKNEENKRNKDGFAKEPSKNITTKW